MSGPYDVIGREYSVRRRADIRIASLIWSALGDAKSVANVGAGTGSYEPSDRSVLAIEPSWTMISQRPAAAAPCIRGTADSLPLESGSFDAAMSVLTMHHWRDWRTGLAELRRVARQRIVLLTFDVEAPAFWLVRDYFPQISDMDRRIMPRLTDLANEPGHLQVTPVPVPHDCTDGFLGAYWRRPYSYLDSDVRASISPFARIDAEPGLRRLAHDLECGAWQRRNSEILNLEALDVGYRLLRWELG